MKETKHIYIETMNEQVHKQIIKYFRSFLGVGIKGITLDEKKIEYDFMKPIKCIYLNFEDKQMYKKMREYIKGFLGEGINSIVLYDNKEQLKDFLRVMDENENANK